MEESPLPVLAVKTKRVVPEDAESVEFGATAISVLVDRWFAENTFHSDEFSDLHKLVNMKNERELKISVALPALNEEETIGDIIHKIQRTLMQDVPLVDELILMDSDSRDQTRKIAEEAGIPVYIHQEILAQHKPRAGKGEALWKSLFVTEGDLIIWVDTDIRNFHPRFVYGIIGPLLQRPSLMLVKGFYRRPLRTNVGLQPGRGGRVTELTARPLFNLMYPGLSGIIQPLSGEYGGRREALEQMAFTSGYGVETSILIEAYERFKLSSIAQADLVERIHRNQDLANLSKMSFAIIQTVFSKLEKRHGREILEDVNRTMKMVRYEAGTYSLGVEKIGELERPPMIKIPEYRKKRGLPPLNAAGSDNR
jgi:glucosyl-3-phosphoglycerate synthase